MEQFCVLNDAYDTYDTYDNHGTQSSSLISREEKLIEAEMFFSKFDDMKKQEIENLKTEAKRSLTTQKLKQANMEEFLAKNQPTPGDVYSVICLDVCLSRYPNTTKLFKFALLILSTISEFEHGFTTMNLIVSPLHTSLNDANVDRLTHICRDGPANFSDKELEQMVDTLCDSINRRIVL